MIPMQESSSAERVFLSAEWRDLVMLNYEVEASLLQPYVPRGTDLDTFNGQLLVSLVGFRFLKTKLFGAFPIPFHSNFDEVNLRFYVRRRHLDGDRRGVVFIREIVPKCAIAYTARAVYGERYTCLPMKHFLSSDGSRTAAAYEWKLGNQWCGVRAEGNGDPVLPANGSLEQFITEHYWGYSSQRNGGSLEYQVEHIPWRVWAASSASFEGDTTALYGSDLAAILRGKPHSAFIAEGSPVRVLTGTRIV